MDKLISIEGERIEIRFPYSIGMVKAVKQIPLVRWDRGAVAWWCPKSPITAKIVREFGNQHKFTIDGRIVDLANDDHKTVEVDRSPLYDYQKVGVDFIHDNNGTCMLSDSMGLGKTLQAIWYMMEADTQRNLIVAPASVLYKWQDEFAKWAEWEADVIAKTKQPLGNARVQVMSYDIMSRRAVELMDRNYDMIVADEFHRLKSGTAKRTMAFQMLTASKKLFLSGTPMLNRPVELFPVLNMINPVSFGNYWSYVNRYCNAKKVQYGTRKFTDVNGASNIEELKHKLSTVMLRRTKQDVLKELPELTRSVIQLDLSNKKEYRQGVSDLRSSIKKGRAEAVTKLTYLRQVTGLGKVDGTVELATDILDSNPEGKLVVYAHHKSVVKKLVEAFKDYGVDTIVGDDSNVRRASVMKAFQNNSIPRVLVISSAGGEGVDLFKADNVIIAELPWHNGALSQIEGRLHRIGQTLPVTSYIMVAKNTVDEHVLRLIERKLEISANIIGEPSVETALLDLLKEV